MAIGTGDVAPSSQSYSSDGRRNFDRVTVNAFGWLDITLRNGLA